MDVDVGDDIQFRGGKGNDDGSGGSDHLQPA